MDWKALQDRWVSKKLLAFVIATALLWLKVISESTWETCALAYLGSQGLVDAAAYFKNKLPKKPTALDGVSNVLGDLLNAMTPTAPPPAPTNEELDALAAGLTAAAPHPSGPGIDLRPHGPSVDDMMAATEPDRDV